MKILVVSSYLPFPLYSGGHIRLYNILKRLNKNHEITLVCERRDYQTQKDISEVEKICRKVISVPRKKQWSFSNILKTGFSAKSFLLTGHDLPEMKSIISKLLASNKFNLIHVETFYVAQNLPQTSLPVVIGEHNIEYEVYRKYADSIQFFLKTLLKIDIAKIKNAEENTWKNARAVVAVSSQDKEIIEEFNKNTFLAPNGVDLRQFTLNDSRKTKSTVLYIGDFKWVQNRDAVRFILEKIWPSLTAENKKLKLWVVGKNIPEDLKVLGGENVFFDENAPDDTSEIFKKADILLAPLRVAGGTSYKILEAMASGVPVVTTKFGASGLNAGNDKELIIADDKEEIIEGVERLLGDKKLFNEVAKNARKLIEDKYDWDKIVLGLEKAYEELV